MPFRSRQRSLSTAQAPKGCKKVHPEHCGGFEGAGTTPWTATEQSSGINKPHQLLHQAGAWQECSALAAKCLGWFETTPFRWPILFHPVSNSESLKDGTLRLTSVCSEHISLLLFLANQIERKLKQSPFAVPFYSIHNHCCSFASK